MEKKTPRATPADFDVEAQVDMSRADLPLWRSPGEARGLLRGSYGTTSGFKGQVDLAGRQVAVGRPGSSLQLSDLSLRLLVQEKDEALQLAKMKAMMDQEMKYCRPCEADLASRLPPLTEFQLDSSYPLWVIEL
mgnify:CR=1 FL=1